MIKKLVKGKTAVFIDAANIYYSCKTLKWKIDYKKLLNYFKKNTELYRIAYYGAFNPENKRERKFLDFLEMIGFEVKIKKIKFIKDKKDQKFGGYHKGNIDVDLTIDAIHYKDNYDTFVLLSGDSDFDSLIKYLKRHQKRCIVMSTKGHISIELLKQAKFVDFKKIKEEIQLK